MLFTEVIDERHLYKAKPIPLNNINERTTITILHNIVSVFFYTSGVTTANGFAPSVYVVSPM